MPPGTAKSKKLLSDERSNVLIYLTGHGGDGFLKFQDTEEINAHDMADALQQMHEARRYNQVLLMIDTCQASTMMEQIRAPRVTTLASSVRGESSYSYQVDDELGVAVLDRFTWALLEFTADLQAGSPVTMAELYASLDPAFLHSHADLQMTPGAVAPEQARVVDFFGNVRNVQWLRTRPEGSSQPITGLIDNPSCPTFTLEDEELPYFFGPPLLRVTWQQRQQMMHDWITAGVLVFLLGSLMVHWLWRPSNNKIKTQ